MFGLKNVYLSFKPFTLAKNGIAMNEEKRIIMPSGGYRNLIVFKKSEVIYQTTVFFCKKFLPPFGDRTVDQMIQAARSCKQNIAEGSSVSGTSKESEIKLTNVAKASLDELLEDYIDFLKAHNQTEWAIDDIRKIEARKFSSANNNWDSWQPIIETRPAETICNLMIVVIQQTKYLLEKMIAKQEEEFTKCGGIRERMYQARTAYRVKDWETSIYSVLAASSSLDELAKRAEEIKRAVDCTVSNIKRKNGWLK